MNKPRLELEGKDNGVLLRLDDRECFIPPDLAIDIARTLISYSGEAKHGGETLAKQATIEAARSILVPRVMLIIKNLQSKKKPPDFIAAEVVDRVLGEIM